MVFIRKSRYRPSAHLTCTFEPVTPANTSDTRCTVLPPSPQYSQGRSSRKILSGAHHSPSQAQIRLTPFFRGEHGDWPFVYRKVRSARTRRGRQRSRRMAATVLLKAHSTLQTRKARERVIGLYSLSPPLRWSRDKVNFESCVQAIEIRR